MKSRYALCMRFGGLLMLSIGVLSGCIALQPTQLAAVRTNRDVGQLNSTDGKARIHVFHGPVRTCKASECIDQKLNFPFSVYVDGIQIGTVTSRGNYLRADVPAGKHLIQWKDIVDSPEGEQGDMEITVSSGQAYFIRVHKGNDGVQQTPDATGVRRTGYLENAGAGGQTEVLDKAPIVADRDAMRRLSTPPGVTADRAVAPAVPTPGSGPIAGKLSELKNLYEHGLITKDEYDGKRKQFLDAWN